MSTRIRTALALAAALVAGGACYASQATATPAVTTLSSAAGASAASTSLDPALAAKLVEFWRFDGNGNAEVNPANNLTAYNSPSYPTP